MKRWFFLVLLPIAACAPQMHPQAAMDRLNAEYAGRDVNDFFTEYGAALGSKKTEGGRVYRWISLLPAPRDSQSQILTYPTRHFGETGGLNNGEMVSGYCEISIYADKRDRIRKLAILSDSTGKFSGSRCAEIFGQSPD